MSKLELLKKLEYMVAFQSNCLNEGRWDDFDKTEGEIRRLEKSILMLQE